MLNVVERWTKAGRLSWFLAILSAFVVIAVVNSGCNRVAPVLKIGLVGPFEGRYRDIGYDAIYSARMAIREVNEAGGIGPYRLALVALDDFGDPEMSAQSASALLADPGIVVVIGHWLPETTAAATPVYQDGQLALISTDSEHFRPFEAEKLPAEFRRAYAEVTPFDEEAGPYAGPAYDAMQVTFEAISLVVDAGEKVDRESVRRYLPEVDYQGITGDWAGSIDN